MGQIPCRNCPEGRVRLSLPVCLWGRCLQIGSRSWRSWFRLFLGPKHGSWPSVRESRENLSSFGLGQRNTPGRLSDARLTSRRFASLAQSVERFHGKEEVDSSILSGGPPLVALAICTAT